MKAHELITGLTESKAAQAIEQKKSATATESKEDLSTSAFLTSILDKNGRILQEVAPKNQDPLCDRVFYDRLMNPRIYTSDLIEQIGYYFEAECKLSGVDTVPNKITSFDSCSIPTISIRDYIKHFFDQSSFIDFRLITLIGTFILARECAELTKPEYRLMLTPFNIHRVILTCALVATKFYQDRPTFASDFAKEGLISCKDIREQEHELCVRVDWKMATLLSGESFQKAVQLLVVDGIHTIPRIREVLPKEYKFNEPCKSLAAFNEDLSTIFRFFKKEVKDESYNGIVIPPRSRAEIQEVLPRIPKRIVDSTPWTPEKPFRCSL